MNDAEPLQLSPLGPVLPIRYLAVGAWSSHPADVLNMPHSDPSPRRKGKFASLDDFERAMIECAIQWEPYGGPRDEDLFPRFGLTYDRFVVRIESVLRAHGVAELKTHADRELIRAAARLLVSYRAAEFDQALRDADATGSVGRSKTLALPPSTEWRFERGIWKCRLKKWPT